MLTQAEVFRTAHEYLPQGEGFSFGDGLKHGINEVCRCCKSPANKISGEDAKPFKEFYKTFEYQAYECPACGYQFSWYKRPQ